MSWKKAICRRLGYGAGLNFLTHLIFCFSGCFHQAIFHACDWVKIIQFNPEIKHAGHCVQEIMHLWSEIQMKEDIISQRKDMAEKIE